MSLRDKRSERECLAERLSHPRLSDAERVLVGAGCFAAVVLLAIRVATGS